MKTALFAVLSAIAAIALPLPAVADENGERAPSALWSTWSGAGQFELRGDYLERTELEILVDGQPIEGIVRVPVEIRNLGSISIYAPNGNFEDFDEGRLDLGTDIVLRYRDREVSLEQLVATGFTNKDHPALRISDGKGRHLLTIAHPHVLADQAEQLLTIKNADLWATDELASALGFPPLAGYPIGMAALDLNLYIPPGADLSGISPPRGGLSCSGRPQWPQQSTPGNLYEVDVELISIGQVVAQDQGAEPAGQVKVAPSATLKSVSDSGDAVWIPKFSSNGLWPYIPEDQHPYLVWNMYRIHDGRIEQIGASGVKHAFFTININCTINCGSGNVLWPGCEDVYGTGTNNSNSNQGPRYDINPASGLFTSSPSFFDPGNAGSQTNTSSSFENRMMINDADLQVSGADYFLDAWYVVMHDVDIWNSMGYHSLNPNESGGLWTFGPLGPFSKGPPISEWVPEGTTDPLASHVAITVPSQTPTATYPDNLPQGHLRVLARATEVSAGRWRYNYAIQNFDFDRDIDEVRIPLPAGAGLFDTFFGAPVTDGHQTLDWSVQRIGDELVFTAPPPTPRPPPAPAASNALTWFSLFNFELETDVPPIETSLSLGVAEAGSPAELTAVAVAPGFTEDLFADGFESPP